MQNQAPFVDVQSFAMEAGSAEPSDRLTALPAGSPFLALYEAADENGRIDAQGEEYVAFFNELYDDEFDDAVSALVDEATVMYETHFAYAREDPETTGYQAERLLNQHFAPLAAEAEVMFEALAGELGRRDPYSLTQGDIDTAVDRYQPAELEPSFEGFLGKLKKAVKKVAGKAVSLAKKGISAAAKLGLGPILEKLKGLIKPLLKRVVQTAIGKLPMALQPMARKLAERLPFLKEFEEDGEPAVPTGAIGAVGEIQYEFNQGVANILFAADEVEQDLEVARAVAEPPVAYSYPLAHLDRARDRFVGELQRLRPGEDPTPHVEQFVPAVLPALKVGIKLIGRKRVVDFLAKFLGRLIQRVVGPQHAPALSQAIVDAGLRLIQLEATPEDEARAAASAVTATIEDTVRRAAAAPDYILDDQELFEGFALEAFEQAAAANLPPVLPEDTYRRRPDLAEARTLHGAWVMMPRGARKRYKKFSRRIPIRLMPHKVAALQTFKGAALEAFLEEQLGMAPGEEQEAFVHLYEAIPGTRLGDIARLEEGTAGLGVAGDGQDQLHPLTREAAALLVGEPDLGRSSEDGAAGGPGEPLPGERFYYLEIPGRRPLTVPGARGGAAVRRRTGARLILDFPGNQIRVHLFLSEIRAQELAVKLRQHAHIGAVAARLHRIVERELRSALAGGRGRLKIVHEAVTPDRWTGALRRLPSMASQVLLGHLTEWVVKGVSDHLKQRSEELVQAAENTADGVTLLVTVANPPGLPQLRQALKGKAFSPASLKLTDGAPTVTVRIEAGYVHE